jgi:hypothetical protein
MSEREAFEAWYCREYGRLGRVDVGYVDSHTSTAWAAWQAATLAERERCAMVLELGAFRLAPSGKRINQIDRHIATVLDDYAAAIRA